MNRPSKPYEYDEDYDILTPEGTEHWIDKKVHDGLTAGARGGLEVLMSGFGKGLMIAAALTTAYFVGGALIAPAAVGIAEGLTAGAAITNGLMTAGNFLLGSLGGFALMASGGALGSMISAHNENNRISADAALAQARFYECERGREDVIAPSLQKEIEKVCEDGKDIPCGHFAQMLKESKMQAQEAAR